MQVVGLVVLFLALSSVTGDEKSATVVVPGSGDAGIPGSSDGKLDMIKYYVTSEIKYRFAHTVVSSTIVNRASRAQEVSFSVIIPDTAFISGFLMQVDGKVYEAYVKEKEEAEREYDQAVSSGQTAAHVAVSVRDSNQFTVSVNIEAYKEVTFNLTYDELLTRRLGVYTQEIYLNPGQIVEDFQVVVSISDAIELTKLFVPEIKTSEEITTEASTANSLAVIERPTLNSAIIKFIPTTQQQKDMTSDGIKGKFIVQYDVSRTASPGEVLHSFVTPLTSLVVVKPNEVSAVDA